MLRPHLDPIDFTGIFADKDDEDDACEAVLNVGSVRLSADVSVSNNEDISFDASATTYDTPHKTEASSAGQTGVGQPSAPAADAPDVDTTPMDKDVPHTEADMATRRFVQGSLPSFSSDEEHVDVNDQVVGAEPEPEESPSAGRTSVAAPSRHAASPTSEPLPSSPPSVEPGSEP